MFSEVLKKEEKKKTPNPLSPPTPKKPNQATKQKPKYFAFFLQKGLSKLSGLGFFFHAFLVLYKSSQKSKNL